MDAESVKLVEKEVITEKALKYFTQKYKKTTNFGKMYLLSQRSKIHKSLVKVPGRPVVSNCGISTEKGSEFLDHHLQPIMLSGISYIKETNGFLLKLKDWNKVPNNAILVTTDVVRLYPKSFTIKTQKAF